MSVNIHREDKPKFLLGWAGQVLLLPSEYILLKEKTQNAENILKKIKGKRVAQEVTILSFSPIKFSTKKRWMEIMGIVLIRTTSSVWLPGLPPMESPCHRPQIEEATVSRGDEPQRCD